MTQYGKHITKYEATQMQRQMEKEQENEEGISSEEYISFIDNKLRDDKSKEGLKNIFNVFSDPNTGNISWNTFPSIAKELGDNEMAEKLLNLINQSRLYTKELNFREMKKQGSPRFVI